MKFLQGGAPALLGQRFAPVVPQVGVTYRLNRDAPNNGGELATVESVGGDQPWVMLRWEDGLLSQWSVLNFSYSFARV